ncbi:zinc metalloprotease [Niabella drilacis]|uniref:Uncharacterized protein n=1 Tax=Niabella drilacis (strain DSM 25811 / CCM 8410 / CCUG 62505 / LMG 26954 / E90) TaxID=1285928 RepID=A0A1G6SPN4_NIADE|nr:hypothetical protein [Niabella drilacis]SDD18157.1 hypothetical protein SAMN04487894_106289 [Niabella drilacis]
MSRTRIVKGTYTKITHGNHNMYSRENINSFAGDVVKEKGEDEGVYYGDPEDPPAQDLRAKCIVQFRPHNRYDGEFGFDWVRQGDTGAKGDTWYRDILGNISYKKRADGTFDYCSDQFNQDTKVYDNFVMEFDRFSVPWKMNGKYPFIYSIPFLSLLPNYTARLNLKVEVEEEPEKYELEWNQDYFDVLLSAAIPVQKGKHEVPMAIEIKCKGEFETDQKINVYAIKGESRELAGRVVVKRNHKKFQKHIRVLFIKVQCPQKKASVTGEEALLKKFMRQAYVNVEVQHTSLILRENYDFEEWYNNYAKGGPDNLLDYLNQMLQGNTNKAGKPFGKTFDSFFRVFFLPDACSVEACGGKGWVLGHSEDIPEGKLQKSGKRHSILIFDKKKTAVETRSSSRVDEGTITHEILHCIGFWHTFLNPSKYTFKKYTTDNVMDYYSAKTNIQVKQLYKWQWDLLHTKLP